VLVNEGSARLLQRPPVAVAAWVACVTPQILWSDKATLFTARPRIERLCPLLSGLRSSAASLLGLLARLGAVIPTLGLAAQ